MNFSFLKRFFFQTLKKEKTDLIVKNKKLLEENQKMKKLVLIKEQNEKELTAKVENYPFLQQKLKALEAILKRKKITGKLPSFEKMDESSVLQKASDNKKLKDDSDVFFYNFFFFFYLFFNSLFFFFFFFF